MLACGTYEVVVDLKGEIVGVGVGVARLCRAAPEALVGSPVTRLLRGPVMTAPYGEASSVTLKTPGGDIPGLALRLLEGEHLLITVVPTRGDHTGGGLSDDARRAHTIKRLVDEAVHGIYDPLTGIIGFASLSHLATTAHRRRYCLDQVAIQAERCRRLLSALDAAIHDRPPLTGTADACEAAARAVRGLRLQLEGHGISVDLAGPPSPVWVATDPEFLGDALSCFISRGTLETRRAHRAHEVAISCRPPDGDLAPAVRILMSGFDVISDELPGRFDPREPTRAKTEPTLSDVAFRATCERLGQLGASLDIAVSSDGEEVMVTLTLPPATPPPSLDQLRTPVPLDILAIDDDAMMGELYTEVLGVSGHAVTSCRTLRAAREALRSQRFDVVVADFHLVDGTLPELWAAAADNHPELQDRLIIVTARPSHPRVREWVERAEHPVLRKPFTVGALLGRVAELVA